MRGLKAFFAGRNGLDGLFYFCFVLYLVLYGFNFIFRSPWLYYGQLLLLLIAIFRMFSKNLVRRQKENETFLRIMTAIFPNMELNKRRLAEGRDYNFKECPYCGAVLRFPRKRGKFTVTCPKCQHTFTFRSWL